MERPINILITSLIIALLCCNLNGQVECNKEIYKSFIADKMNLWENQMKKMEDNYKVTKSANCLYDLTFAEYGFIVYCILTKQRNKAQIYLNKAEHNANKLLKHDLLWAEIYSLKAALYGFKIEFNKMKAPKYGLKSLEYMDKAMKLDKNNARVWMEKGNISYYIPAFLGGGLSEAIACHEKSIKLFEKDNNYLKYNWLYLLVLTNLGRWYTEANNIEKAKFIYEKALEFEPEFLWVKNDLYPKILNK